MINHFRGEYGFLSNMYNAPIIYEGIKWENTETAFMWEKCRLCEVEIKEEDKAEKFWEIGDIVPWTQFCMLMPPNIVKKKSREVELRPDWNEIKLKIMYDVLVLKFTSEPFREKLLATGDQNIVEGNYWNDKFWGVDLKETPNEGENWLGRLIMDIRNKLQKGRL